MGRKHRNLKVLKQKLSRFLVEYMNEDSNIMTRSNHKEENCFFAKMYIKIISTSKYYHITYIAKSKQTNCSSFFYDTGRISI